MKMPKYSRMLKGFVQVFGYKISKGINLGVINLNEADINKAINTIK